MIRELAERGEKNPAKVRAGQAGMRVRWGNHAPLHLSLHGLSVEQRFELRTLVAELRAKNEASS